MTVDVFSIRCGSLADAKLVGFRGTESLGRCFEFDVFFTVPSGTDVKPAVGQRATLTAARKDELDPMRWHGLFARIRLLHDSGGRALYRALLVPKLWFTRLYERSFVFTKKNVKTFASETLEAAGLASSDFRFDIDEGAHPDEEFVCQYRETYLDFVQRWLEREGLYYFFEHPTSEDGPEVMVVVDHKDQHEPLFGDGRVRYFAGGSDVTSGECFRELSVDFESLPASVLITDYNYANPSAPVQGEQAISKVGKGQLREYGYRVFDEGEAARLAQVKAQSIACRELVLQAAGNVLGLRAGYTFELEDGPSEVPTKYLALEVKHAGVVAGSSEAIARLTGLPVGETYRAEVTAIPSNVQFRAPQSTPWPRIFGFENGMVDGSADSEYAQIDDQGRYLVRFRFDASDLADGSTSTYLRMMQPHGGTIEGWHFPLRKGTEVMVAFQGGDPDRPVIAGVVPNAQRPSTVTSANYTQNVLRTGGNSHMVVEDLKGKEHIDLYTPVGETNVHLGGPARHAFAQPPKAPGEDMTFKAVDCSYYVYTDGTAGFNVTGEWWQNVGSNYWVDVCGDATIHYVGTHSLNVDSDSNEFYNAHQNITVHSGRIDTVEGGGMVQTITGGLTQTVNDGGKQKVNGGWKHEVTSLNHDQYGSWQTNVTGGWNATIGGPWTARTGDHELRAPKVSWQIGTQIGVRTTTIDITAATININGECKVNAPKHLEFEAHKEDLAGNAFGYAVFKEEIIGVSVGSSVMKSEITGVKVERVGFQDVVEGTEIKKGGPLIKNVALAFFSAGIIKL